MSAETGVSPSSRKAHVRPRTALTDVVRANLERLVPSHDQSNLLGLFVLEQTNIARSSLLPLKVGLDESEELGSSGC